MQIDNWCIGTPELLAAREGGILRLTLNRPVRRNALTDVLLALADMFQKAGADATLRAIVLTGAGDKAFCAGADLTPGDTPFQPDFSRLTLPLGQLARAAHTCHVPIVGRMNCVCVAGGMGLFGLCDMAIATEDARFGMPEGKVGIFPMQILTVLRDLIPPRFLNEMCITGRLVDAHEAFSMGLLKRRRARRWPGCGGEQAAGGHPRCPPYRMRRGKYAMRAVESMSFHEMMAFTESSISAMIQTADAREGIAAFNKRRPPAWSGR